MKHIVEREYKDLELKRLITKGAVLEEEYKKDKVELTEERINYLTNERKLCIAKEDKEEVKDNKEKAQTEGQEVKDNKEEVKTERQEEVEDSKEEAKKNKDDTDSKTKNTKKEDKNN